MSRLCRIRIDDGALPSPSPEMDQERRVAIFDLLEENSFLLPMRGGQSAPDGPYALTLGLREGRLVFEVTTEAQQPLAAFHLSLGPFRQVIKDYAQICASYFEAVKSMPPARVEAIDMARRGIHNEGARILRDRLEGKARVDTDTARRLFTLVCALTGQ